MKLQIDRSFEKDLLNITQPKLRKQLAALIKALQQVETPLQIPQLSKIQGFNSYYRIRLGDYRVGIEIQGEEITLLRVLHRKEVYRYFP